MLMDLFSSPFNSSGQNSYARLEQQLIDYTKVYKQLEESIPQIEN